MNEVIEQIGFLFLSHGLDEMGIDLMKMGFVTGLEAENLRNVIKHIDLVDRFRGGLLKHKEPGRQRVMQEIGDIGISHPTSQYLPIKIVCRL